MAGAPPRRRRHHGAGRLVIAGAAFEKLGPVRPQSASRGQRRRVADRSEDRRRTEAAARAADDHRGVPPTPGAPGARRARRPRRARRVPPARARRRFPAHRPPGLRRRSARATSSLRWRASTRPTVPPRRRPSVSATSARRPSMAICAVTTLAAGSALMMCSVPGSANAAARSAAERALNGVAMGGGDRGVGSARRWRGRSEGRASGRHGGLRV